VIVLFYAIHWVLTDSPIAAAFSDAIVKPLAHFVINAQRSVENVDLGTQTITIFIDELPPDIDSVKGNAIREAISYWEKVYSDITFKEINSENADVRVLYVKEFGGRTAGHAIDREIVQIGLGDSQCLGKFREYTYESILQIAKHELGHVLGLDHSNDRSNVMYESITTRYTADIEESGILSDKASRFYPVCTRNSVTSYQFSIISDVELDIYVVTSKSQFDLFNSGGDFSYVRDCFAKEVKYFQRKCVVFDTSGIILKNPAWLGWDKDATYTIRVQETEIEAPDVLRLLK
jgi:hypothetical protein